MTSRIGLLLCLVGLLVGCAPANSDTLGTAVVASSDSAATQSAVDSAVSALFAQTAQVAATATRDAALHPSPVPPTPTLDPEQDPAFVAGAWTTALFAGDGATLGRYTCEAKQSNIRDTAILTGLLMGGLNLFLDTGQDMTPAVDFTDVDFSVQEQSASRALVRMQGTAYVTIGGAFQEDELDSTVILVYEQNRWRVCEMP